MRLPLVCALVLVTHTTGNTQTVSAGTEFLNALLKEEKAPSFITYPRALPRPLENIGIPFEKPDATTPVIFVFASGRLFGIPDGTGFVFEIRENNAHIKVTRVDSTIYFGYNFGAMVFPFEGEIYSYGGYGHWLYNGNLRKYLPDKHEWERIPLSREVPFDVTNTLQIKGWFDERQGDLFVVGIPSTSLGRDSVHVLNLHNNQWNTLGVFALPSDDFIGQLTSPWGIIGNAVGGEQNDIYLLDFRNNDLMRLSEKKATQLKILGHLTFPGYFVDSTLVLVREKTERIPLAYSDFSKTGHRIYTEQPSGLAIAWYSLLHNWQLVASSLAGLVIGLLVRRLRKSPNKTEKDKAIQDTPHFEEREKSLIQLVYQNSMQGQPTTIDDINQILGLSDKIPDVQKKHRSDVIQSIDQKFQLLTRREGSLIKKNRSAMDKRSFEFYIDMSDVESLNNHLL